jgi:hypothetical protein
MDFQDAPELDITEEQRKKHEAFVRRIMQGNDRAVQMWRDNLRQHGYSDEEIENLMAF